MCLGSLYFSVSWMEMLYFRCIRWSLIQSVNFDEWSWWLLGLLCSSALVAGWFYSIIWCTPILHAIGDQKAFGEVELSNFFLTFWGRSWFGLNLLEIWLSRQIRRKWANLSFQIDRTASLLCLIMLDNHYWITLHMYKIMNNLISVIIVLVREIKVRMSSW